VLSKLVSAATKLIFIQLFQLITKTLVEQW